MSISTAATAGGLVELTAHPMQRAGAFALAALARRDHPHEVGEEEFGAAWTLMTDDAAAATRRLDAKQPGAFLLAASYGLWPNCKMNIAAIRKLPADKRVEAVEQWRAPRGPASWPDADCVLCGRAACGFFGKVDVPLAMSVKYRNTTVPGHPGLALCRGCLASFYALPYACHFHSGRAAILHSWDEAFLGPAVRGQVIDTRRRIASMSTEKPAKTAYAREQLALERLRRYSHPVTADVSLIVFANGNQEQEFSEYRISLPLATWLRSTARQPERKSAWSALERACHSERFAGPSALAGLLVHEPHRIAGQVARYISTRTADSRGSELADEVTGLVALLQSFVREVQQVNEQQLQEIVEVGNRAAALMTVTRKKVNTLVVAHRKSRDLRRWLNRCTVDWLLEHANPALTSIADTSRPFISPSQLHWLFKYGDEAWLFRNLLFTAVLAELQRLGHQPDAEDTQEIKDALDEDVTDKEDEQ
ncbi:hypothetical protein FHR81_003225 [Actinoalloteichus hoggarensis]|uniref:Uncharacterized protein n=1 Tax=Actinoalloteichus hoggarensis TaxID=1470176 RepID=A0A221W799_9PSEU|nr:hypothetical protein [Actinoalloteichus hoggarensis]ASO21581.1 hypothetical protein AHOG_19815 [Actinoalloteichus hoggarensis]MBB5922173.1 hypothetical protein [Actinoalloteichus hoggarensis]